MKTGFWSLALCVAAAQAPASERWQFRCDWIQVCDRSGSCRSASGSTAFATDQERLNRAGEGTVRLRYDDVRLTAYAISEIGPLIWSINDRQLHTLALSGGDNVTWHVLDIAPERAEIRFLECKE